VIVLPAFMGVVFLYGLAHWLDWHPVLMTLPGGLPVDPTAILGVAGTVLAFALFVCTAMIYACLKFLAEWHSPLTVINYILLGGASGLRWPPPLPPHGAGTGRLPRRLGGDHHPARTADQPRSARSIAMRG
jgi:hypothetical protein